MHYNNHPAGKKENSKASIS